MILLNRYSYVYIKDLKLTKWLLKFLAINKLWISTSCDWKY